MSGDMQPAESTAGVVDRLLSHIFTGTASDAVIALLFLVVGVLCFVVWRMTKRLDDKDKLFTDMVEKSNTELRLMSDKYMDTITEYHTQQVEQARIVNDSITGTRVVLTEIRTLLNVMTSRGNVN